MSGRRMSGWHMTRKRRAAFRTALLALFVVVTSSCSFFANEFLTLDKAGPVAARASAPSGLDQRY